MNVFLVYQSINQIKANYRRMADTLISNCDIILCGGLKTPREYADVAKLIGSRTVKSMSTGEKGISESEAAMMLFNESDMFKLTKTKHLCVLGNQVAILEKPFSIHKGWVSYE